MNIQRRMVFLLSLLGAAMANAGDGSALLNHWYKSPYHSTKLYVTNISEAPITVSLELYDQSGNYYNENSESGDDIQLDNFSGDPTNGGGVLLPKQTGSIGLSKGASKRYGSGIIRWQSESDVRVAATAYGYRNYSYNGVGSHAAIEVNQGNPF